MEGAITDHNELLDQHKHLVLLLYLLMSFDNGMKYHSIEPKLTRIDGVSVVQDTDI